MTQSSNATGVGDTRPTIFAVVGPTASGKSAYALDMAEEIGGEIINCDSVQIYRGFDIGSSKLTPSERRGITHHLLDVRDWNEPCDAGQYATMANAAIDDVVSRGKRPIVVGGTGLYLRALLGDSFNQESDKSDSLRRELAERDLADLYNTLQKNDPQRAAMLHPNDRVRIVRAIELHTLTGLTFSQWTDQWNQRQGSKVEPWNVQMILMEPTRAVLHERILQRTQHLISTGSLAKEVTGLLAAGVPRTCKPMQSIGYKETAAHLAGEIDNTEWFDMTLAATRQYAKRQVTWFKKLTVHARISAGQTFKDTKQSLTFSL